jgi:hypothetical protein
MLKIRTILLELISPSFFSAIAGPVLGSVAGSVVGGLMGGGDNQYSGGGVPAYQPSWQAGADTAWQQAYGQNQNIVNQAYAGANPLFQQSLQQQQAINYDPYLQAYNQAGNYYGQGANVAGQQAGAYGQQAALSGQQQQNLYNAGNQVYQTAFDPQNALFNQTQQQLTEQVNAGQAMRGLGNSAVGGQEYNQAMQNFDISWQNQQLARQAQGAGAMAQASQAGGAQGQLTGANLAAQAGAYGTAGGYEQQQGQVPLSAQQYAAQQPGVVGQQYAQQMAGLQGLNATNMNQAQAYMGMGQAASMNAYNQYAGQQAVNAQNTAAASQLGYQVGSNPAVGNWLNTNIFGGGNASGQSMANSGNYNQAGVYNGPGALPDTSGLYYSAS